MKFFNNGLFINEQTYLDTVCKSRRPPPPRRKPPRDCNYVECSYCAPFGKLTLRCDKHSTSVCVDIHKDKPPCK